MRMEPAKSIRFFPGLDILLLREVIALRPSVKTAWEEVHRNVNTALKNIRPEGFVTVRGCKDRIRTLQEAYRKNEMSILRAAGTEEEYAERIHLLTELTKGEDEKLSRDEGETTEIKVEKVEDNQIIAMETLLLKKGSGTDQQETSVNLDAEVNRPKKRKTDSPSSYDYVKYLKDKLEFDKMKFELEKKEREFKMERDRELMRLIFAILEKKV